MEIITKEVKKWTKNLNLIVYVKYKYVNINFVLLITFVLNIKKNMLLI
jgi:hypothetical protein